MEFLQSLSFRNYEVYWYPIQTTYVVLSSGYRFIGPANIENKEPIRIPEPFFDHMHN